MVGATNRPQELDEAARRRLVKRLYIPLPEHEARVQIINNLLAKERHGVTDDEVVEIGKQTEGYSGADMANLCKEAALGPIRSLPFGQIQSVRPDEVGLCGKLAGISKLLRSILGLGSSYQLHRSAGRAEAGQGQRVREGSGPLLGLGQEVWRGEVVARRLVLLFMSSICNIIWL